MNTIFKKTTLWMSTLLLVLAMMPSISRATTCAGAEVIPAVPTLPLSLALVCNGTNDINSGNATACGSSSYMGGQEALFVWTPTDPYINVSVAYSGVSWTGITFFEGCPTSGGICLGSVNSSATSKILSGINVSAGVTYYIMIDTWPTPNSPCPGTIILNGTLNLPCAGTPAPGNTISSVAGACVGVPFTLSLQNPTTGSGVTYQWESADDALFTVNQAFLGTSATQSIASQSTATYYRCSVTCSGNTGVSTEVFVTQNGPTQCYCTPVTTSGCADGDVVAQVILNTLNNNSGTGCPSGTLGYSDYTGLGSQTNLTAGNTYNCTVWAGQYPESYAAWIDYNDDGVFDNPGERIGYTSSPVAGSGSVGVLGSSASFPITLSCSPSSGPHRLRVRAMYSIAGSAMTPCGNNTYGETEDYIITIDPALPCPAPSALVGVVTNTTTVDLTWVAGCVETAWDVEYGPAGYTAGTGTSISVATNAATLTVPCGQLDYYVRADCSSAMNGSSTWVGPITLQADVCPCNGAPVPGATLSSAALPCPGGTTILSVEFPSIESGVSYQWFDGAGAITGATNTTYTTPALMGGETYYCNVTCDNTMQTTATTTYTVAVAVAPAGSSLANPIMVGQAPCTTAPYSDVQNNSAANCFQDLIGRPVPEVYYQFTLAAPSIVTVSHCASSFDTYMHLLDAMGASLATADDNGPICSGARASLVQTLPAGTYYVASEGWSTTGDITTEISAIPVVTASDVAGCPGSAINLIGTPAGGTFSVANPYTGPTTTYTYTYTDGNGCSNTSAPANITVSPVSLVSGLTLNSSTGTSATVSWDPVAGVGYYTIRITNISTNAVSYATPSIGSVSKVINGLAPGATYEICIRANCSVTSPGPYSDCITISTGDPCPAPINLVATNVTKTSATLGWDNAIGAAWYQVRYRIAGPSNPWLPNTNGGSTLPNSKNISGLTCGTEYEFQVQTKCSPTDASVWSVVGTFTTANCTPSAKLNKESFSSNVSIYPNPVRSTLNIEVTAEQAQTTMVKIFDISGRMIKQVQANSTIGVSTLNINLSDVSNGLYTVQVYTNDKLALTSKVSKQD